MNFGIITSFVIAGMVLLAILTMNFSISQSTVELTMSRNTKEHVNTVSDIVSHDFSKIGYNWMGMISDPIQSADSNKIVFFSNIDNDTSSTAERIMWEFTTTEVTSSANPNDYILQRKVMDKSGSTTITKTDITLGVTNFNLKYYSNVGSDTPMSTPVANPENIRQIEVELLLQSGVKISGNSNASGRYIQSIWQKRFSPINLQN